MNQENKFVVSILLWSASVAILTLNAARSDETVNAFSISKETNKSVVMYDARLTADCHFTQDDPIDIHWRVPNKDGTFHSDGLNFMEKALYGLSIKDKEPTRIGFEVKALRRRGLKIPLQMTVRQQGGECVVQTVASGEKVPHELVLQSLRLKNFSGQVPKDMVLNGKQTGNGKSVSYDIDLG